MDSLRDLTGVFLRGLAMGAADAVPGVSGGTIALITGIYARLIAAITSITPTRLGRLLRAIVQRDRDGLTATLLELDAAFLLALGAGIMTAVITVLSVVAVLLETNPIETYGFFFGLIAASAVVLFREVDLGTWGAIAAAIVGFGAAFVASGQAGTALEPVAPVLFVAGAIAVSAMVLPGLSGSLLLIILGQYAFMSGALSAFVRSILELPTGGSIATVLEAAPPIVVFIAGAFVGLFTVAYAVRAALERYRRATIAFLVSLIVGALRAPIERVDAELAEAGVGWTPDVIALFFGAALLGAAVVVVLDWRAGAITYDREGARSA